MIIEQRQSLPLEDKVTLTKTRLRQWYDHFDGDVYVSFSGGKDSTVLLDIVRNTSGLFDVPAVFCDTGLEYPEVREFALSKADVVVRPRMTFKQVIEKYGYPFPSKEQAHYVRDVRHGTEYMRKRRLEGFPPNGRFKLSKKWLPLTEAPFEVSEKCCDVMKKRPFKEYEKESGRHPIIATMAEESRLRRQAYERNGCNAFNLSHPISTPMGFWTEQDVLRYIVDHGIDYASCYGDIVQRDLFGEALETTGCKRTGCMFCMFGVAQEEAPNRFQRMRETHPKQYRYCMEKLGIGEVLDFAGIPKE